MQNAPLLDMLHGVAGDHGLTLENPTFGLARKGQRMFGVYEVNGLEHFGNRVQLTLGIRNAFDGCISIGVCFGSKVFVCSNLIFTAYTGDEGLSGNVRRKHLGNDLSGDVYERLQESLSQVSKYRQAQERFYRHLEETPISRAEGCEIIINAGREGVIGKKDILSYADEWIYQETGPQNEFDEAERDWHREFQPRNAWSLMNAFKELQKARHQRNPVTASNESLALTRYLHKTFPINQLSR